MTNIQIIDSEQEFTPTSAATYEGPRQFRAEMPSGARFLLRKPDLFVAYRTGQVPPELRDTVAMFMNGRDDDVTPDDALTLVEWVLCRTVVEPPLSTVSKEGHIRVVDLDHDDRDALTKWALSR